MNDFNHPFETARWMWPHYALTDLHNEFALFRKTFELRRVPSSAPLFITADQSYHLVINGHFVCRGPARGFQDSWPYDEVDVAPFLRAGTNVVAIRAHNPGHGTFSYISQNAAGVLLFARWNDGDGEVVLHSDDSWRACVQTSVRRDTVPATWQLSHQEHIDLRLDPRGWQNSDFPDSSWTISLFNTATSPPWHALEARGLPMLRETPVPSPTLLAQSDGECALGFREVRDVVRLAVGEGLKHTTRDPTSWQDGILSVAPMGDEGFASFVFDFGRVLVGNLELKVDGARGGEVVDALFSEITVEDDLEAPTQTPWHDPEDGCNVVLGSRLVCRDEENAHTFFHHYGFRILCLRVRGATQTLRITPTLHTVSYPLERRGAFASSDKGMEEIWDACAHTGDL